MGKKTKQIKQTDIKGNKPWLKKVGLSSYNEETKDPNKTFLIVCEGQTEALYFDAFPTVSAEVKSYNLGCSKNVLVDCAIEMAKDGEYDEVWCVFDYDFVPGKNDQEDDFNSAILKCSNHNIYCAYSNDAFELWIYLHFEYTDQRNLRSFYFNRLSNFFGINYVREGKIRKFSSRIYQLLLKEENSNQQNAINRAKELVRMNNETAAHLQNPITFVHLLVEELNKYLTD